MSNSKKKNNNNHHLSTEEQALLQEEMQGIKPLQQTQAIINKKRPLPQKIVQPSFSDPNNILEKDEFSDYTLCSPVQANDLIDYYQEGVQHSILSKLKRGKIFAEDELDLHGYNIHTAKLQLKHFFDYCQNRQYQCVRIIHGKGKMSQETPVLKNKLNNWLRHSPRVLAFASAPRQFGGAGAVHVLIKRKKNNSSEEFNSLL
ncbi:Smr/MutS family protein [Piscirickettsia salmonis]|uniref:Smr/MutS family protein n=1 Tax=Piscirickettsia salmonis TaxID=1238 RepID=UPI00375069AB